MYKLHNVLVVCVSFSNVLCAWGALVVMKGSFSFWVFRGTSLSEIPVCVKTHPGGLRLTHSLSRRTTEEWTDLSRRTGFNLMDSHLVQVSPASWIRDGYEAQCVGSWCCSTWEVTRQCDGDAVPSSSNMSLWPLSYVGIWPSSCLRGNPSAGWQAGALWCLHSSPEILLDFCARPSLKQDGLVSFWWRISWKHSPMACLADCLYLLNRAILMIFF